VKKIRKKPIIGILGGISSGKSTVAAEFAKLGCAVIDADAIAHQLLDKKSITKKIIQLFGESIIDSDGKISRRALADIVFADEDKLLLLNEILHPLVLRQTRKLIKTFNNRQKIKAIVLDMPLLAEVGWTNLCNRIIFVKSNKNLRITRAIKMGIPKDNIKKREKFQISLDKKQMLADNMVENNSDFSALVSQVDNIFIDIIGKKISGIGRNAVV
jgi:dephospho-CoA kinase